MPSTDEEARMVVVDDDEGEVPLEVVEGEPHRFDQVAVVVALDRDG